MADSVARRGAACCAPTVTNGRRKIAETDVHDIGSALGVVVMFIFRLLLGDVGIFAAHYFAEFVVGQDAD